MDKYSIQDLSLQLCGHEHPRPPHDQQLGNDNFLVRRQRATDIFRVLLLSLRSFHLQGVVLGGWMIDAIASSLEPTNNSCRFWNDWFYLIYQNPSRVLMGALLHNTSLLYVWQGHKYNSSNHQEEEEESCRGILQRNRQLRGLQNLLATNDLTDVWLAASQ